MRTPKPAGPGLPRAPPSMYARIMPGGGERAASGLRLRRWRGLRHEVENARAAVALDDGVVSARFVEDLRTQADVADGAQAVACLGHRDAAAATRVRSSVVRFTSSASVPRSASSD